MMETPDCVSITLDVPQYLEDKYRFLPGQHLIFKHVHAGEEIRRSYSICASPLDGQLRVASKRIEGGIFSTHLNGEITAGDELEVSTPQGQFTLDIAQNHQKVYLAIAAGSGITPVISQIKTILSVESKSRVVLLFGNRHKTSIIFKEELEALKNTYMERFSVYHIMSGEPGEVALFSGRIDANKIRLFVRKMLPAELIDEVLLCGPEEMILSGRSVLQELGIAAEHIHFELFYSAKGEERKAKRQQKEISGSPEIKSKVSVKLDGKTMVFHLGLHGDSILEAALKLGADLPYACKGGVCATCRCMLEDGQVEMDINYSLEPDELARGFVLACQSHPLTEEVTVNFDMK